MAVKTVVMVVLVEYSLLVAHKGIKKRDVALSELTTEDVLLMFVKLLSLSTLIHICVQSIYRTQQV